MLVHLLRHLALRLWLTVLIGGLGSLALVPLLQALMGLTWVILPVILLLMLVFLGIGWGLNAWAGLAYERLRAEGAVWERAGMRREAAQRYEALMGLVDSFMFTPRRRRQMLSALLPLLTRFYLDQGATGAAPGRLLRAHLEAHPGDAEVAAHWLQLQVNQEHPPAWAHELAQRIGEATKDSEAVTALLVQFYLGSSRSDSAALALYRRYWRATPAFRKAKAVRLAQLLKTEGRRGRWALEVYVAACSHGAPLAALQPVMRQCLADITPTRDNSELLQRARELAGEDTRPTLPVQPPLPQEQPSALPDEHTFRAASSTESADTMADGDFEEEAAFIYRRRRPQRRWALGAWLTRVGQAAIRRLASISTWAGRLGKGTFHQIRRPWGRTAGLAILALALVFLITNTITHLRPGTPSPPPPQPAPPPVVTDPFTIQVAAYLKAEDARAFAAQLKAKGLDAYWTEAVGANRNWYQVRIDHFASKTAARQFGEDLKAKGLINDFYVANYRPPAPAEKK